MYTQTAITRQGAHWAWQCPDTAQYSTEHHGYDTRPWVKTTPTRPTLTLSGAATTILTNNNNDNNNYAMLPSNDTWQYEVQNSVIMITMKGRVLQHS
jgi:hypothetical protein